MINRRNLIISAVVILLIVFIWQWRNKTVTYLENNSAQTQQSSQYPELWSGVSPATGTELKIAKSVESGLKPEIVLIRSTKKDDLTSKAYVDRLIAGAKSTIPSLRITEDKEDNLDSFYYRRLSGYYYNQKIKIFLQQRIYINNDRVFTATASFDTVNSSETEINQILDTIYTTNINQ